MKHVAKTTFSIALLTLFGAQLAPAAQEHVVANTVTRLVDKKTKTKDTITVVANPQNDVEEPIALCAFWDDTISKPNKGNILFEATFETDDFFVTGSENPSREDGSAWACFFLDDDPITANDLAWVDVTPNKLKKQKPSDIIFVELDVGARFLVEVTVAKKLGLSTAEFRKLFEERAVRLTRTPKP